MQSAQKWVQQLGEVNLKHAHQTLSEVSWVACRYVELMRSAKNSLLNLEQCVFTWPKSTSPTVSPNLELWLQHKSHPLQDGAEEAREKKGQLGRPAQPLKVNLVLKVEKGTHNEVSKAEPNALRYVVYSLQDGVPPLCYMLTWKDVGPQHMVHQLKYQRKLSLCDGVTWNAGKS